VALQDSSFLDVWPESTRFNGGTKNAIQCCQLLLNRGDVVVFRGDLVHGGAAFAELNIRVHCYLEPKNGAFQRPQESDGTEKTQLVAGLKHILPRGSVVRDAESWL